MISSCFLLLLIFHCYWFPMDWLVFALNLNCPKKHQRIAGVLAKEFDKNSYTWVWIWYLKKVFFTSAEKPWQIRTILHIHVWRVTEARKEVLKHKRACAWGIGAVWANPGYLEGYARAGECTAEFHPYFVCVVCLCECERSVAHPSHTTNKHANRIIQVRSLLSVLFSLIAHLQ